jgi:hypothetical protein
MANISRYQIGDLVESARCLRISDRSIPVP